jgi:hypothetical protein
MGLRETSRINEQPIIDRLGRSYDFNDERGGIVAEEAKVRFK